MFDTHMWTMTDEGGLTRKPLCYGYFISMATMDVSLRIRLPVFRIKKQDYGLFYIGASNGDFRQRHSKHQVKAGTCIEAGLSDVLKIHSRISTAIRQDVFREKAVNRHRIKEAERSSAGFAARSEEMILKDCADSIGWSLVTHYGHISACENPFQVEPYLISGFRPPRNSEFNPDF